MPERRFTMGMNRTCLLTEHECPYIMLKCYVCAGFTNRPSITEKISLWALMQPKHDNAKVEWAERGMRMTNPTFLTEEEAAIIRRAASILMRISEKDGD